MGKDPAGIAWSPFNEDLIVCNEGDNTLSILGMVRSANWVTILPQTVVRIMPDDLAFRKIDGLTDRRTISLLTRERSPYLHLAEELGDIVREFDWD